MEPYLYHIYKDRTYVLKYKDDVLHVSGQEIHDMFYTIQKWNHILKSSNTVVDRTDRNE